MRIEKSIPTARKDGEKSGLTQERSKRSFLFYCLACFCSGGYFDNISLYYYVALKAEGLPVILRDAEEILARFDATDYVGIVPHHIATRYCEHRFPQEYGHIIDFMHVYEEEMEQYGEQIKWLPESPARLTDET